MRFLGGVSAMQWWAILSATPLKLSKGEIKSMVAFALEEMEGR
jgi:hypothetical protein